MKPENYRAIRERLGLTQSELAEKLGVASKSIEGRELGEIAITAEMELAILKLQERLAGEKPVLSIEAQYLLIDTLGLGFTLSPRDLRTKRHWSYLPPPLKRGQRSPKPRLQGRVSAETVAELVNAGFMGESGVFTEAALDFYRQHLAPRSNRPQAE